MATQAPKMNLNDLKGAIRTFREKLDQPEKLLFDASEVNEKVKKRVKKAVRSDGS